MRNLLIFREESLHFPRAYFERRVLRLFAPDLNAVQIADLTRLSRVSINRHLTTLRQRMARLCAQAAARRI